MAVNISLCYCIISNLGKHVDVSFQVMYLKAHILIFLIAIFKMKQ